MARHQTTSEDYKDQVRQRVLDAWGELLSETGYEGTTVAQVATRAGLVRSSVYRYFPDKESLFFAYIEERIAAFVDAVRDEVNAEQDAPSRLRTLVVGELRRFATFPDVGLSDVPEAMSREGRARLLACFEPLRALVRDVLQQGRREGSLPAVDVDAVLPVVLACIDVFRVRVARQWLDPDAVADDVADFVLRGLGVTVETVDAGSPRGNRAGYDAREGARGSAGRTK